MTRRKNKPQALTREFFNDEFSGDAWDVVITPHKDGTGAVIYYRATITHDGSVEASAVAHVGPPDHADDAEALAVERVITCFMRDNPLARDIGAIKPTEQVYHTNDLPDHDPEVTADDDLDSCAD